MVVWVLRQDLRGALLASGIAVAALVVWRLIQRQTVRYALSSVAATAIAAAFALRTGRAEDAFLPSILWNLALGLTYLGSVIARWPLMGFLIAAADPRVHLFTAPGDVTTRWLTRTAILLRDEQLEVLAAMAALLLRGNTPLDRSAALTPRTQPRAG